MNMNFDKSNTTELERVRYFSRQLITADDMLKEQEYFRQKLRRHNRYLHGWGVVCGCQVVASPTDNQPWRLKVCPGYIITPLGDEIEIPEEGVYFDLAGDMRQHVDPCSQPAPCSPASGSAEVGKGKFVYLAVCYTECSTRPVRIQVDGCNCDETACEYSRVRESFELVRLHELPDSHVQAAKSDVNWMTALTFWIKGKEKKTPFPLPECFPETDDACVVLARIGIPPSRSVSITGIENEYRRICMNGERLTKFVDLIAQV